MKPQPFVLKSGKVADANVLLQKGRKLAKGGIFGSGKVLNVKASNVLFRVCKRILSMAPRQHEIRFFAPVFSKKHLKTKDMNCLLVETLMQKKIGDGGQSWIIVLVELQTLQVYSSFHRGNGLEIQILW